MPLFNRIQAYGITRLQFFYIVFLWILIHLFLRIVLSVANAQKNENISLIVIGMLIVLQIIFALFVYLRMKNANVKHTLAMVCCFVPFPMFWLAPLIAGCWYKSELGITEQKEEIALVDIQSFAEQTSNGWACQMNLVPYYGYSFLCACGQKHTFSDQVEVLRELSYSRLVVLCPLDGNAVTCVKITGILRFNGFKSLFGTK